MNNSDDIERLESLSISIDHTPSNITIKQNSNPNPTTLTIPHDPSIPVPSNPAIPTPNNTGTHLEAQVHPKYKPRQREPIPIPAFDKPPWQIALETLPRTAIPDPHCYGHTELVNAHEDRRRVSCVLGRLGVGFEEFVRGVDADADVDTGVGADTDTDTLTSAEISFITTPLFKHLEQGLALTTGSALGCVVSSVEECLKAYMVVNKVGMMVGARAWAKHAHRSMPVVEGIEGEGDKGKECEDDDEDDARGREESTQPIKKKKKKKKEKSPTGWWGNPKGPLVTINERALNMFFKIMNLATWRNLHWLPHEILVYEVRVEEGYGMRWSKGCDDLGEGHDLRGSPGKIRGLLSSFVS